MEKTCTRCQQTKPLEAFPKRGRAHDARATQCKVCRNAVQLIWRNKNLEKARESLRKWKAVHSAEENAKMREWRKTHPEESRQRYKYYYAKSRDKRRAQARKRQKRMYQINSVRILASAAGYYRRHHAAILERRRRNAQEHPEINRRNHALRRARRLAAPFVEYAELDVIFLRDQGICSLCHLPVKRKDASRDHIIPVSKGGEESYRNVVLAHKGCNSRKNNRVAVQQMRLF